MKAKNKISLIITLLVVLTLISGCKTQNVIKTSQQGSIYISSALTSIGEDESNGIVNSDTQSLSYSFTLFNNTSNKIHINSIEPTFEQNFAKKVINKDISVAVQKDLLPNSSITIEGSKVKFDAKGMTKEQISQFAPYITDIKVKTEEILDLGFAKKTK